MRPIIVIPRDFSIYFYYVYRHSKIRKEIAYTYSFLDSLLYDHSTLNGFIESY